MKGKDLHKTNFEFFGLKIKCNFYAFDYVENSQILYLLADS